MVIASGSRAAKPCCMWHEAFKSGALPFRHRSSLGNQATQLPTPAPASDDKPLRKLAAYLPAILVEAYTEAGIMHDLYPWQVQPPSLATL